ncbi:negative regulator of systemic acquired resistance SNI1-like [Zingiber officinale]|uniref:negative regulator of systemic acquired resistance SNI1-like n=1 Tax=Zingiber officinale TaxID=94328 RepID=UPI001C4B6DA3|nr:negative regulator of systemic acquired resistance SNI1-like [Zingiber officinale]
MKSPSSSSSSNRRASSGHRNNNNNASIAVWEENTMAILDSSGIKDSRDVHDDRLCFLEAVRSASLASESPSAPSWRIFDAIFQILTDCNSLELAMASFQLLIELDKHYPRVYLSKSDELESSSSDISKLVVVKEAWSPFNLASGSEEGAAKDSCYLFDPLRFSNLIDDMAQAVKNLDFDFAVKPVQNSLVFQYLVNVVEVDLLLRLNLYKETLNWSLLRESVMNLLLGSRKLNFKSVVRDCMSILLRRCHHSISNNVQQLRNSESTCCSQSDQNSKVAVAIAISQLEKETCVSIQKFVGLVIELDAVRKEADSLGQTSRFDGLRLPITEFIVEELTYNKDNFAPLLLVFSEPKWKLEIILLYFSKYLIKPSVRTRRSNDTPVDVTLESVLSNFSTTASTKNIVKKVSSDLASLLLAHAFQACLSLIRGPRQITNSTELIGANLLEICSKLISAIKIIRRVDGKLEITSFTKEALFTAAMILKTNA